MNWLRRLFPTELSRDIADPVTKARFDEWDRPTRSMQISVITFLTAALYVIYAVLDKPWAPFEVQGILWHLYLFVFVPLLFSISVLAYSGKHYKFLLKFLTVFPWVSMPAHAYVASLIPDESRYLTEGYLGVIWTFVVCGLPFKNALLSATVFSVMLGGTGFYFVDDASNYVLHLFWLFCSYSFGVLSAWLLDRARKSVFLYQEELHDMAVTDELTGIFNRNKFNNVLAEQITHSNRYHNPFGLLLIDIDHFKSINDRFGHDVGDLVLKQTAQTIKKHTRENDLLVRWGGEEFAIIVLEVDRINFKALSEKLRKCVADIQFEQIPNITASVGASLYQPGDTPNSILKRADTALYQAKKNGRNCVIFADDIVQSMLREA